MQHQVVFAHEDRIGMHCDARTRYWNSEALTRYRKNLENLRQSKQWKEQGGSAIFRGEAQTGAELTRSAASAAILCVQSLEQDGILYSYLSDDSSGLFIKPLEDAAQQERHVLHKAGIRLGAFDYSFRCKQVAVALGSDDQQHIALVGLQGGSCKTVTAGDCVDDNPSWSALEPDVLFFDSRGIARDAEGRILALGPGTLLKLDMRQGEVAEVFSREGHDCLLPRQDARGNLYFLQKPYRTGKQSMSPLEVLAVPFKLGKAVFNFFDFFTRSMTGEALNKNNTGDVKLRKQDMGQLWLRGNLINAERTLKENQSKGEAYPGIAPRDWQLMRQSPDGTVDMVRRGILDYDLCADGGLVFSNGKYLVYRSPDGVEEKLDKLDMVTALRVKSHE